MGCLRLRLRTGTWAVRNDPGFRTISTGQDVKVATAVALWQGQPGLEWGRYNTLGFWDSRGLKVGLVYNNYSWPNIAIHVGARPGALWCRPEILAHIFGYPFLQLKCARVTAPVRASNVRCRRAVEALGFRLEGMLRKALPFGEDMLLYGMLAEECRWLPEARPAQMTFDLEAANG